MDTEYIRLTNERKRKHPDLKIVYPDSQSKGEFL